MRVELDVARFEHRGVIADLLDDYLEELARHREVAVGATDSVSYPYLDAYFSEAGRHAFVIRGDSEIVGFALIRGPASTGCPVSQVAEFYVLPSSRGLGVGREAVTSLWRRFPGAWELQVHARNTAALRFWDSCIQSSTRQLPVVTAIRAADGKRFQLNFCVE